MATALADIPLGSTTFTKGIKFPVDDQPINASAKSVNESTSGKSKHFGIIIGKDATGIIVAGSATFNGATTLVGTVKATSLPYFIPVTPATQEAGMTHAAVARSGGDATKRKWINIRGSHTIAGASFTLTPETYSLATVNTIRAALGLPAAT